MIIAYIRMNVSYEKPELTYVCAIRSYDFGVQKWA